MKVVVASRNPVKVAATRAAFASLFADHGLVVQSADVPSGVAAQPLSDAQTRQGALNRARNASSAVPGADFWVGLEGGIEMLGDHLSGFAWMAIAGRCGNVSEARSVSLPLPPSVRALVAQGYELGEANDQVFATTNSKQAGGAFGLLTDGLYTREDVYTQALVMALVPFANDLYPWRWQPEGEPDRGS